MSNKWVSMVVSIVVFVAVWNLITCLISTFALGGYRFSLFGDIVIPAIVGGVVDYFFMSSGDKSGGKG